MPPWTTICLPRSLASVILITLYNPTGEGGHQGGGVAAPDAGKILSEIISYLEIPESE